MITRRERGITKYVCCLPECLAVEIQYIICLPASLKSRTATLIKHSQYSEIIGDLKKKEETVFDQTQSKETSRSPDKQILILMV